MRRPAPPGPLEQRGQPRLRTAAVAGADRRGTVPLRGAPRRRRARRDGDGAAALARLCRQRGARGRAPGHPAPDTAPAVHTHAPGKLRGGGGASSRAARPGPIWLGGGGGTAPLPRRRRQGPTAGPAAVRRKTQVTTGSPQKSPTARHQAPARTDRHERRRRPASAASHLRQNRSGRRRQPTRGARRRRRRRERASGASGHPAKCP